MTSYSRSAHRRGFTLVEFVVTVVVIVLLIALLLPAVHVPRERAPRNECARNLKQFGLALHTYYDAHGNLPPAIINSPDSSYIPKHAVLGTTGWVLLLPYLDKQSLYDQYDFTQGAVPGSIGLSETNRRITATRLRIFNCQSDEPQVTITNYSPPGSCFNAAGSNYLFGAGSRLNPFEETGNLYVPHNEAAPPYGMLIELISYSRGVFGHNASAQLSQVSDGLSCSIAAGETLQEHATGAPAAVVWGQGKLYGQMAVVDGLGLASPPSHYPGVSATTINYPRTVSGQENAAVNPAVLSSKHKGGVNILFADGAVRFINEKIDPTIYSCLFMIHDGAAISDDFSRINVN